MSDVRCRMLRMRQYQVPQFITVEDKVFGPFTIKQSVYLGAGGLIIVGSWVFLESVLFWPITIIVGALAASLSFLKINEQPFPVVLKNAVFYFIKPRLYIWKKAETKSPEPAEAGPVKEPIIKNIPKISDSKLTDLAWSLDIKSKRE